MTKGEIKKRRVFIDGEESLELEEKLSNSSVEFKGVKYFSYSEGLFDTITKALSPIKKYGEQVWEMPVDPESMEDIGDIICALENNARMVLETWLKDFEKHIGAPEIEKIANSYSDDIGIDGLDHGTPFAVSFRRWGKES